MQALTAAAKQSHWLKEHALKLGFDDVGIAAATLETPSKNHFLQFLLEDRQGPLDYLQKTAEQRADLRKWMPTAQFVVMVVKNYYAGDHADIAWSANDFRFH